MDSVDLAKYYFFALSLFMVGLSKENKSHLFSNLLR